MINMVFVYNRDQDIYIKQVGHNLYPLFVSQLVDKLIGDLPPGVPGRDHRKIIILNFGQLFFQPFLSNSETTSPMG
ncbi:MAG: hypothetical protein H6573_32765 [Lewinellaceae bacterium]|nr:hypothetical protein [Lewinellaceae bacterium]